MAQLVPNQSKHKENKGNVSTRGRLPPSTMPPTKDKNQKPGDVDIDVDDAMLEEPKDDAFEKKDKGSPDSKNKPKKIQSKRLPGK